MSAEHKRKSEEKQSGLDPYFAFLIFTGIGLGTWRVEAQIRLTALWSVLLALTLIYANAKPIEFRYALVEMGRGAVIGSIISLPFLLLTQGVLSVTSARLFPIASFPALFQSLVLLAAPVEELFFRGFLQRERGLVSAAILYSLAGAVFFLGVSDRFPLVLAAVAGTMGLLGFIYGYVYNRYGLSASIACHAVVNLFLLFLPPLLDQLTLGVS